MKKTIALMVSIILAGTMFAGCGKKDSDSSTADKSNDLKSSSEYSESVSEKSDESDVDVSDDESESEKDSKTDGGDEEKSDKENTESVKTENLNTDGDNRQKIEKSDIIGKWQTIEVNDNGQVYTDKYRGVDIHMFGQIEFSDDTFSIRVNGVERNSAEWDIKDDMVFIVDSNDDSSKVFIEDDELYIVEGEMIARLEKVDEFETFDEITEEDIIGKWEVSNLEDKKGKVEKRYKDVSIQVLAQYEFNDDGTGTVRGVLYDEKSENNFKWSIENNCVKIDKDSDERSVFLTYSEGTLSYNESSVSLYFAQVDEFTEYDYDEIMKQLKKNKD